MRKPSQTETSIQSREMEENKTRIPNRYKAESPNPTKKPKRNNIIPPIIAMCVLLATNRSASAVTLSFNINTQLGDVTNGTLTLTEIGMDANDGLEQYSVEEVSGSLAGTNLTLDPDPTYDVDDTIEVDGTNGDILTDGEGIAISDSNNNQYFIYQDSTIAATEYAKADTIYETDTNGNEVNSGMVTRFTGTASESTAVPFQAPLAEAIPVIGSVLVLGALRKVRNFKKA